MNKRREVRQIPQSHVSPRTVGTGVSMRTCVTASAALSNDSQRHNSCSFFFFLRLDISYLLLESPRVVPGLYYPGHVCHRITKGQTSIPHAIICSTAKRSTFTSPRPEKQKPRLRNPETNEGGQILLQRETNLNLLQREKKEERCVTWETEDELSFSRSDRHVTGKAGRSDGGRGRKRGGHTLRASSPP